MKKFFNVLLKILLIVLIVWILLKVHNTYELKKIYDGMQLAENSEYFHRIINSTNASPNHQEIYAKDDKTFLITEYNDENDVEKMEMLRYGNDNEMYMSQTTKDGNSTLVIMYGNGGLVGGSRIYTDSIPLVLIQNSFNVGTVLKNLITPTILFYGNYQNIPCYIIKSPIDTTYISRETLLPVYTEMKEVKVNSLGLKYLSILYPDVFGGMLIGPDDTAMTAWHTEHEYSLEKFDDSILDIPDFSKYTNVVLAGSMDRNGKAFDKTEKAISGTDLEAGERLITNIDLQDDEELDYYRRIGNSVIPNNSSELGKIDIFDISVYNKVRERAYKNLPELTRDDFVNYAVSIVYKEGYKLNFEEVVSDAEQDFYQNYLVKAEPSDKPSVLLIIRPYTEVYFGNLENLNAVEKLSDINITAEEARKTTEEVLDQIKEDLNTELEPEIRADELVNIDFSKTQLQTKIGEVPNEKATCWQMEYFAGTDVIYVLVNANSGEIIGTVLGK